MQFGKLLLKHELAVRLFRKREPMRLFRGAKTKGQLPLCYHMSRGEEEAEEGALLPRSEYMIKKTVCGALFREDCLPTKVTCEAQVTKGLVGSLPVEVLRGGIGCYVCRYTRQSGSRAFLRLPTPA